ncbi:MAG: DNA polymerase III, partial [Phycisphaerae bacterium]
MPVHNHDIAEAFNQLADLLEIKGENQFRIRAYRNAARTIGSLPQNAADLVAKKADLTKYEGIGKDLAGKIEYFVKNREMPLLEELKKEMPAGIVELMRVAGLGAKRIAVLQKKLGVGSLDELKEAAEQGKIEEVEG